MKHACIVIDNGSGLTKTGYASMGAPKKVFDTVIGRERSPATSSAVYVGDEALENNLKKDLVLKYPIEYGIVTNWDDMEKIWEHTFKNTFQIEPEDQTVLVTEACLGPKANRERTTQIMFETFNVSRFYIALQGVLSLYASGRTTGMTWESGAGVSYATPIYEGYALPHAILRSSCSGNDIDNSLYGLIKKSGQPFAFKNNRQILRDIKETKCFTALKYPKDKSKMKERIKSYKLPDGERIDLTYEVCTASELLFTPQEYGIHGNGLVEQLNAAAMNCDTDIRFLMYENIVLSGGTTMFPGLQKRVVNDLLSLAPSGLKQKTNVIAPPNRKYLAWYGGSILASLSTFQPMYITNAEYQSSGPGIVHRKCF